MHLVFFSLFSDSILRGNWLDDGAGNGLEFSTVWDSNSLYNSTGGGIYATGQLPKQTNILCVFHCIWSYYRKLFCILFLVLIYCILLIIYIFQEGTSNYFKGLMLILCYLIVGASFFVHVDPDASKYSCFIVLLDVWEHGLLNHMNLTIWNKIK